MIPLPVLPLLNARPGSSQPISDGLASCLDKGSLFSRASDSVSTFHSKHALRTLTKTSLIKSVCELTSGSCGMRPHGDRHSNVKGRGPVSMSAVFTTVSVTQRWLYVSPSIIIHCFTQSSSANFGVGKSLRCFDHLHIPLANVLWSFTMVYR